MAKNKATSNKAVTSKKKAAAIKDTEMSAAGKIYHQRKDAGLCVRCGKKAVKGKLMCQEHLDYIRSFSKGTAKATPVKGQTIGKKAKAQPKAAAPKSGKTTKAYKKVVVETPEPDEVVVEE